MAQHFQATPVSDMGSNAKSGNRTVLVGLTALTFLFFAWGFLTALNDVILPHLRSVFTLSYGQSALVQTAFFFAYFISSLPSSLVVAKFGYKHGLAIGLTCMALGCLLFLPAAALVSFPAFLLALFVLGSGITLLQVAANPYVTLLGKPEAAASRLNLTQAFNSIGTTIAPILGGHLILKGLTSPAGEQVTDAATQAAVVRGPYLVIALVLLLMAAAFYCMHLPEPGEEPVSPSWNTFRQTLTKPRLTLGIIGIFLYVGAEVAIGSFLISFITEQVGLSVIDASKLVSFYWGGAMIGRFLGSFIMRKVKSTTLLQFTSAAACILLVIGAFAGGNLSVYALLAIGLCNAIMFPTIFSLGVDGLGALSGVGSSLLVLGIVGGAVVPLAVGSLADQIGLGLALASCILAYAFVIFYGRYCANKSTIKNS